MKNNEDKVMYNRHDVYYDGRSKICPIQDMLPVNNQMKK